MAGIKTAKNIIKAGREAGVSVWLWGAHGIGKSDLVAQVAKKEGIEMIDIRAALTEAGDWMGLPVESSKSTKTTGQALMQGLNLLERTALTKNHLAKENANAIIIDLFTPTDPKNLKSTPIYKILNLENGQVVLQVLEILERIASEENHPAKANANAIIAELFTPQIFKDFKSAPIYKIFYRTKYAEFLMSSFLPQDPNWKGIIFLDELNRARPDIINCVFQLVLNRKIMNHYTLPKGASIVAASNPADDEYDVTNVDPALLGRFCHVSLTPPVDEWLSYSKQTKVRPDVVNFVISEPKLLDFNMKSLDLEMIKPSRRSWTMLSAMVNALERLNIVEECILDVSTGLVGTAAAIRYDEYRRSGMKKIDVEKILSDYKSVRNQVKQLVKDGKLPEQKQALEELFESKTFVGDKLAEDETKLGNLLLFLTDLSDDVAWIGAAQLTEKYDGLLNAILMILKDEKNKLFKEAKAFYNTVVNLDKIARGEKKEKK